MNKVSTFSFAMACAGAFIGAGFVSGQELWQFFGAFGSTGIFTLVLSLALLGALCALFTSFCIKTERYDLDSAVFPKAPALFVKLYCALELVLYFFLCVIMTSGFISLTESFFDKRCAVILGAVFSVLVGVCLFLGLAGLVKLFSLFVPLLVLSTLALSFITLARHGIVIPEKSVSFEKNPLVGSPIVSALLSLSYNFFGSVGILAPLSKSTDPKSARRGSALGIFFLLIIALSIILSIFATDLHEKDLPTLEIAKAVHPVLGAVYALLLAGAMFSCSFSSGVCVLVFAESKFSLDKKARALLILLFVLLFYICSLFGFSNLISTVYPIFGYIGFVVILAVVFNSARHRR